jgi:predicted lipid-binding transport protein (Tim44 family)
LRAYVEDRNGHKIMRKESKSEQVKLIEYWTLARSSSASDSSSDPAGWKVVSIEQRAEGDHHLESEIVASPWSDSRIADEALTELASADKVPDGFTTADLAELDFDEDARARALDLSLADARFAPDVLEIAARRAVEAWAEAVDGEDTALNEVAAGDAVTALLYGGDATARTRVVVRGPRVRTIRIDGIDVESQPATMTIQVEVHGRRYIEDRDTAAVTAGSKERATSFTERWTLALDGPDTAPWRLVDAAADQRAA